MTWLAGARAGRGQCKPGAAQRPASTTNSLPPSPVPHPAPPAGVPPHAGALALLRQLSGPHGIHASAASTANYRAVFARDGVMAGVAGLLAGDATVVGGLVRTLEGLRALQGPEGQIASNYEHRGAGPPHVSFGTLAPRIDATTWYLVGVGLAARAGALGPAAHRDAVGRVVRLLDALEYNGRHLVYVPTGGNWADEYVYEGYILYDQVLRAWGLRLVGGLYAEPAWEAKAARIGETIAARYATADGRGHPPAALTPARAFEYFDLAACALLALAGAAPGVAAPALDWIDARYLGPGALPPAFAPVIEVGHPDWAALARYHLHGFRNRPHEYHNGGVWPIWLGWLALALAQAGRAPALAALRSAVRARVDAQPAFAYEEYFHGVTGTPAGTPQMAYTATGLVFLDLADAPATRRLLQP